MKPSILLCSAVGLLLQWPAQAAEDCSAHGQQPASSVSGDHSAHGRQPAPVAGPHVEQGEPPSNAREDHSAHAQPTATAGGEPSESELRHVPPAPPRQPMRDMSTAEMVELMDMDDTVSHGMLLLDRLEWGQGEDALAWEGQAWYGGDYDKLWLKFAGNSESGEQHGSNELLWDRNFSRWWSWQAGVRNDFGPGPSRTWAAAGVQGLAPYWFEVAATVYLGEAGRTAARVAVEYELLITQRLIVQPQLEVNFHGKDDVPSALGSGLSDTELGLRLRYEIRREFAPYVGVAWSHQYGRTADLVRAAGHDNDEFQWVIGVRAWF